MQRVAIAVLGPVQVDGATLRPRERVVLAALALTPGRAVRTEHLTEALWRDNPPATAPKQLQICIGRLRKALGPDAIETTAAGYRLRVPDEDLDAIRFEHLVSSGRDLIVDGEPDRAEAVIERALTLWRGDPFDELDGWEPAISESVRLCEMYRTAEEDLLDARLAAADHRDVAAVAELLVAQQPLRERRWVSLALAQYRCGRQADALRTLGRARVLLRDQLGVDPGRELSKLEAAVLQHDPSLAAPVHAPRR
jgi:DNA-binding SARP family transcriptional activator